MQQRALVRRRSTSWRRRSSSRRTHHCRGRSPALPAIYQWPETADEGGLIGYGPRLIQIYREIIARQLVKLLRGAKPADIPVEQPTKFELVINLKTAKALGLRSRRAPVAR